MKNILTKNWAFIGWLLAVLLDKSTGFVEHFVPDAFWQNFIYVVGTGALAYFWTSKYNVAIAKKRLRK
ncbi:hypothetical protein [Flavobacterium sp.]|uniref:hypothetical protein n=1 Tax=Flavobacterium sp. TaxID=239 RepID=UPI00375183FC